ncbi:DUF58 domain-containing protein [Candidatus Woesearchaeota archaeon]|nr:DUF58 domain-containing protein [Candidatus Woesearchaeota archaeon]
MKEVLQEVRKVELSTRGLVQGLLQGAYHSVFKGRGIEFSEVREYVPGDDVRAIDWNVTARMDHPYVKEFIEERDLTVYLVLDRSGSFSFGSDKDKRMASVEIAASLMFAALKNNDNVGLMLFTDEVEKYVPARKGRKHVLRLIREALYHETSSRNTDIAAALRFIMHIAKKRSIIFLVSDFLAHEYSKELSHIAKKHDVVALRIEDPHEQELPDVGYVELEDEETGEQILVDTSDPEFRKEYERLSHLEHMKVERLFMCAKTDVIPLRTDQDHGVALRKYFHRRHVV